MRKKRVVLVSLVSLSVLILLGVGIKFGVPKLKASADSSDPYVHVANTSTDLPDEIKYNMIASGEMAGRFMATLPYSGPYKAPKATGKYTVDRHSADDYPDYFGGFYVNVNGKLIVCIKDTYYEEDYRNSDWYLELSGSMGSEDFGCQFVNYNYTELVNGLSVLLSVMTKEAYEEKGIEIVEFGLNEYKNCINVGVRTEKDVPLVKELLGEDMCEIEVVGDREFFLD